MYGCDSLIITVRRRWLTVWRRSVCIWRRCLTIRRRSVCIRRWVGVLCVCRRRRARERGLPTVSRRHRRCGIRCHRRIRGRARRCIRRRWCVGRQCYIGRCIRWRRRWCICVVCHGQGRSRRGASECVASRRHRRRGDARIGLADLRAYGIDIIHRVAACVARGHRRCGSFGHWRRLRCVRCRDG